MRKGICVAPLVFVFALAANAQVTVVSSATFLPAVAPASIVSAFGNGLAAQQSSATLDQNGQLPTMLGGTSVTVNGQTASLIFVSPAQVNFIIPSGTAAGSASVAITNGGTTQTGIAQVQLTAAGIFTIPCLRPDRGAIENAITNALEPFRASTPENPGTDKRTILSVYGTGIRFAGNTSRDGSVNVAPQVTATITDDNGNTYTAAVQYAGEQPSLAGLDQVNIILPATVEGLGTVTLVLAVAGQNSNSVTMVMSASSLSSGQSPNLSISSVASQLNSPLAVAFDASHNLYIADSANHIVRRVDSLGNITAFAGNGTAGSSGDGGPAAAAELRTPNALAFDSQGNLYIADNTDNRIRKVSSSGTITTFAGTGLAGFSGDGGLATAGAVSNPGGIAVNAAGTVVIADTGNNRVRRVTSDGLISTVAGSNSAGINSTSSAYLALLNQPTDVAVDSQGNILVADAGNFIIRRIATDGSIFTIGGSGIQGSSGTACPATQASFGATVHLATDTSGNLWISDTANNKVRLINSNCYITDAAGNGTAGSSGDGGAALQAQINGATGLAVDSVGNVYLADTLNQRVREMTVTGLPVITFLPANPHSGQPVTGVVSSGGAGTGSSAPAQVQLSSSVPIPGLPAFVTIPAGRNTATFTLNAPVVSTATPVAITASGGGVTASGSFTAAPALTGNAGIASVTVAPSSVTGGSTAVGKVQLTAPAPIGGTTVSLSSNAPSAAVSSSITIPQGQTSGEFLVTTNLPAAATAATITASAQGSNGSALLGVNVSSPVTNPGTNPLVSGITISPATLTGGQSAVGTVSLGSPAGTGGATVSLSSSNSAAVTVPATAQIAAGQSSATFPVTTIPVGADVTANVTANGSGASSAVTVKAPCVSGLNLQLTPGGVLSGGGFLSGTVTLNGPAASTGANVQLTSKIGSLGAVAVLGGQSSATVNLSLANISQLAGSVVSASTGSCGAVNASI